MDLEAKLTPHFKLKEFFARIIKFQRVFDRESWEWFQAQSGERRLELLENLRGLAARLESVRELFGASLYINSGLRSPAVNIKAGGVNDSQHREGRAADIEIYGVPAFRVQHKLTDWDGGLGCYASFTHVDTGPRRRW